MSQTTSGPKDVAKIKLCFAPFSGRSEKQDGCPGLWVAETFSTSPLKPLNIIQWNLTGSKISTSSTKLMFFGPVGKTRGRPGLSRLRHFQLLLWNHWTEFNETWQEARSQCPLPSLCFLGRSEKEDGRPGLWLTETFSTSPLKPLNEIQTKLDRKEDLNVLYQVYVFRAGRKNKRPSWPLTAETFSTSPLKPLNGIQRNLTGSKISTSSTKLMFFGPVGKTRGRPGLSRLRHFQLLLWNHWTEFNETWQEARSQCPLPSLCFLGRSEKEDGRPGLWLTETFSTSPLKPLNEIQTKLDRKEDLNVLYQVCNFRADWKNKMATLYSG